MDKRPRKQEHWFYGSNSVDMEELNVVEFPLGLLARAVPKSEKVLSFEDAISDKETGERIHRTVTISANANTDLPNWWDQDVLVALQVLTNRKHGFRYVTVEFTLYEVLKMMGLPNDNKNRKRLGKSLDNWVGLLIKYSHWRDKEQGKWTHPKAFGIIQGYDLTRTGRGSAEAPQLFKWNELFVESIRQSHTKPLDADFYFGLELPTTRRLFRFLDKRFGGGQQYYQQPLVPFCVNKLGMAGNCYSSQYPRKLQPAYKELISTGFLADVPEHGRFPTSNGQKHVLFRRGRGRKNKSTVSVPIRLIPAQEQILIDRACSPDKAQQLTENPDVSREQMELVAEWFDWEVERGKQIPNPGGWIYKACLEGWKPPGEFKPKSEREAEGKAREERKREQREQKSREEQQRKDAAAGERQKLEEFLVSLGTDAERKAFEERAAKNADAFVRKQYTRTKGQQSPMFEDYRFMVLKAEMERQQ